MPHITRDNIRLIAANTDLKNVHEVNVDGVPITFEKEEETDWIAITGGSGSFNIDLSGVYEVISADIRFRGRSSSSSGKSHYGSWGGIGISQGNWVQGTRAVPSVPSAPFG